MKIRLLFRLAALAIGLPRQPSPNCKIRLIQKCVSRSKR